ncbi:MAG: SMP-30/gluconolactonase/LRE family protein [Prolixibacteraceae bacterium]
MKPILYSIISLALILAACGQSGSKKSATTENPPEEAKAEMPLNSVNPHISTGSVERFSPELDSIIPEGSLPEIIAEGFVWCEGPVWLPEQNKLIFGDIPRNSIFQWSEKDGLSLYLDSAGYAGPSTGNNELYGSNGLVLNLDGNLVLCQHGNRQVARMDAPLDHPDDNFTTLANQFNGKRLNSPNDVVFSKKGDLYFTDPPYGLPGQTDGPTKELGFQGVYKLSASGELTLIDDKLYRPNGIGLSPDNKTLYVSNSDPEHPLWKVYSLNEEGLPEEEHVFFDAAEYVKNRPDMGLPDGMVVGRKGNVFATGPGGVYVFSPSGKLLGIINTGHANGNCTFNADESVLYITADMYLMRIKLR